MAWSDFTPWRRKAISPESHAIREEVTVSRITRWQAMKALEEARKTAFDIPEILWNSRDARSRVVEQEGGHGQ